MALFALALFGVSCSESTSDPVDTEQVKEPPAIKVERTTDLESLSKVLENNPQNLPVVTSATPEVRWEQDTSVDITQAETLSVWARYDGDQLTWTLFHQDLHLSLASMEITKIEATLKPLKPLKSLRIGWVGKAPKVEEVLPLLSAVNTWEKNAEPIQLILRTPSLSKGSSVALIDLGFDSQLIFRNLLLSLDFRW